MPAIVGRAQPELLISAQLVAQLSTKRPEMAESHNIDILAYFAKAVFWFPGLGKVLDDLVSSSVFELADCVLVTP